MPAVNYFRRPLLAAYWMDNAKLMKMVVRCWVTAKPRAILLRGYRSSSGVPGASGAISSRSSSRLALEGVNLCSASLTNPGDSV